MALTAPPHSEAAAGGGGDGGGAAAAAEVEPILPVASLVQGRRPGRRRLSAFHRDLTSSPTTCQIRLVAAVLPSDTTAGPEAAAASASRAQPTAGVAGGRRSRK